MKILDAVIGSSLVAWHRLFYCSRGKHDMGVSSPGAGRYECHWCSHSYYTRLTKVSK